MANKNHVAVLKEGMDSWNKWRNSHPRVKVNLSGASLTNQDLRFGNFDFVNLEGVSLDGVKADSATFWHANLRNATIINSSFINANLWSADLRNSVILDTTFQEAILMSADFTAVDLEGIVFFKSYLQNAILKGCNLQRSHFQFATLIETNLQGADLRRAILADADFERANLRFAKLQGAHLDGSNLTDAKLFRANLRSAHLSRARLIRTDLRRADLEGSTVYGISAWDSRLDNAKQTNLIITPQEQPTVTVDDLEIAQFVYQLLENRRVREIIDTITSKVVLILGRFTHERKLVLDALRIHIRGMNFTPILFDFDKPASKDLTGTVETLARMARFIVADITDPSCIPHELATIVPFLRTTPIIPLKLAGSPEYTMLKDWQESYKWVLETYEYYDIQALLKSLPAVIAPAEKMAIAFRVSDDVSPKDARQRTRRSNNASGADGV